MILHDFVTVDLPFAEATSAVLRGRTLYEAGAAGYARGERLRLRMGASTSGERRASAVRIVVGTARSRDDLLSIPLLWEVAGTPGLFSRLDANLDIAPLGESFTQMTFFGSYHARSRLTGPACDHVLRHHVAELTIREFLRETTLRIARPSRLPACLDPLAVPVAP